MTRTTIVTDSQPRRLGPDDHPAANEKAIADATRRIEGSAGFIIPRRSRSPDEYVK